MSATKRYFKEQFRSEKFTLEHEDVSTFYLSCWQNSRSAVPLLCLRCLLFLGSLGIVLSSLILTGQSMALSFWPIYMTHWGIIMITVACGLSFAVSAQAYLKGPIDGTLGTPWYLKLYWVAFNIAISLAFFITIFYYSLLTSMGDEYAVDPVLDLFIHGMNSVVMFVLLVTSQQPAHLLHFWHVLVFMILYLIFTIIYYFAGGVNPFGDVWIYPMLDWSDPGLTLAVVVGSAVVVIVVHFVVTLISLLRDHLMRRYVRRFSTLYINE